MLSANARSLHRLSRHATRWFSSSSAAVGTPLKSWSSIDMDNWNGSNPATGLNLVNGEWKASSESEPIIDPLNGEIFISMPKTQSSELAPFVESMKSCPKHGLHNPLLNVDRYLLYGDISNRAGNALRDPEVQDYFARMIQRVSPKSYQQAVNEVVVTRRFLDNFSGDQVRFLCQSFGVSGDHQGQESRGYRWPYGSVALITPFNFPFEIPVLQLFGALFMGNKVMLKVDSKVSIVMQEALRLFHACGMPMTDVDLIHSDGPVMNQLLLQAEPRNTLFTGSATVAEKLAVDLKGRVKLEDAGYDWKILGPDVSDQEFVAYTSDQDAYACSGQKCSAQSILFMHENWVKAGFEQKIAKLAAGRNLDDLTVGPVLTVTTERMLQHINALLELPGARIAFGGKELENHSIPKCYGAIEPTAVFVPLSEIVKPENFSLVTTEIFGPLQILTEYNEKDIPTVLSLLDNLHAFLTASVVSNDIHFQQKILSHTVNGTTYCGIRGRTTGAPQNHWFGPAGDPRAGGIGTPEAIKLVWSGHREIIHDVGPVPTSWTQPPTS